MARIVGTGDDDTLVGNDAIDVIFGYGGNDLLYGSDGRDTLYGGAGNDILRTKGDSEVLNGGSGRDALIVTNDYDLTIDLRITGFQDVGFGDTGMVKLVSIEDVTLANVSNDRIYGSFSANFISAQSGKDSIFGLDGDDSLYGGLDNDIIYGGINDDIVDGAEGRDVLFGGSGDDIVFAGAGSDKLSGGVGEDRLYGGEGRFRDDFIYRSVVESPHSLSRDIIFDFQRGVDKLDLSVIDANTRLAGNQSFTHSTSTRGEFLAPDRGTANSAWFDASAELKIVTVYADNSGDGFADLSITLFLRGFSGTDFIL